MDHAEYLDRHGVTAYMKDVVTLLLENRPASPIAFVAKYFATVTQGTSPLLRAYRYIQLTPFNHSAFVDNLVAAYATLDARRGASYVTGEDLLRLLRLLCSDCPLEVSTSLLHLLDCNESEPVSFDEFAAAVRAGLLYARLLLCVRVLFNSCDPQATGGVPQSAAQLALHQLRCDSIDAHMLAAIRREQNQVVAKQANAPAHDASVRPPPSGTTAAAATPPRAAQVAAARSALHRLHRDVQCAVGHLSPSPERSTSRSPLHGHTVSGLAPPSTVSNEEFNRSIFASAFDWNHVAMHHRCVSSNDESQ